MNNFNFIALPALPADITAAFVATTITGTTGNDTLTGGSGADTLYGGDGDDALYGGAGNDQLDGEGGNDGLYGGDGNDRLTGNAGDDTFFGGTGNDFLTGGVGNDVFMFGRTSGNDTIDSSDTTAGKADVLQLTAGVLANDVKLTRQGDDLLLAIKGTADTVRVQGYFIADATSGHQIEQIKFADGTAWSVEDVKLKVTAGTSGNDTLIGYDTADFLSGLAGNDLLEGQGGNDTLDGGAGNDTLDGGSGDDQLYDTEGINTYVFGRGSGVDVLNAEGSGEDVIQLKAGISASDVTLRRTGDLSRDLVLSIKGTTDQITANFYYHNRSSGKPTIAAIQFADGTRWDANDIAQQIVAGTSGNDRLVADDNIASALNGFGGNDVLIGSNGNDTFDGGAGNDLLSGGDFGLSGNDTFVFGRGQGQDTIFGGDPIISVRNEADADIVRLAPDIRPEDILLSESSLDNLLLRVKGGTDSLMIEKYFDLYHPDDATRMGHNFALIQFADGTVWNADTVKTKLSAGTSGNDRLRGTTGADSLRGQGGNDRLIGYTGDDLLDGGAGSDKLEAGVGNDTLYGGTGDDDLEADDGDDWLSGGDGNDSLHGGAGNDTFFGGAGNDTMNGADGSDVFMFGRTSGQDTIRAFDSSAGKVDVLQLTAGIVTSDVSLKQTGNDLLVAIKGTTDSARVAGYFSDPAASSYQLDQIKFADGTTWGSADIRSRVVSPTALSGAMTAGLPSQQRHELVRDVAYAQPAIGSANLLTQADSLVSAMAGFAAPAAGETRWAASEPALLGGTLAAAWN